MYNLIFSLLLVDNFTLLSYAFEHVLLFLSKNLNFRKKQGQLASSETIDWQIFLAVATKVMRGC